tara:strand:+ start:396 stop:581 length:186 start_codon:yes stop_codon:yes gene_type:complete
MWTKKETQQTIKQLREGGIEITKTDGMGGKMYKGLLDGELVFQAGEFGRGYLVRITDEWVN